MSRKLPEKIFVKGEAYTAVVGLILDRDVFGRPSTVQMVYHDQRVQLEGAEEFFVMFAHQDSVIKESKS